MRADARQNYAHILETARTVIAQQGADASLRDIARQANVGDGTLHRHFPTREALLEALLRSGFDELAARAADLAASSSPEDALRDWLCDTVAFARTYRGVTSIMMTAIEDTASALHASCITMRTAGTQLLRRAQAAGTARPNLDGTDLFALIAALAWLGDQPSTSPRFDHLLDVIADAILPGSATTSAVPPRA